MRKQGSKTRKNKFFKNRKRILISAGVFLLLSGSLILGFAVRASNHRVPVIPTPFRARTVAPLRQQGIETEMDRLNQLGGNPEPDRLRQILGQRFLVPGKEVSVVSGTLTVGATSRPVSVTRQQQDDGESTALAFDGGSPTLDWNRQNGATLVNGQITSPDRSLTERLTLDSPDQFILAQLRGASYYFVAHHVVPADADENYTGPVWDVVRVGEPDSETLPKSSWRMYYINTVTGLIDRVISREDDVPVMAEFSNWVNVGGELSPGHVVWTSNGQVVMDFVVSNISYSSAQ